MLKILNKKTKSIIIVALFLFISVIVASMYLPQVATNNPADGSAIIESANYGKESPFSNINTKGDEEHIEELMSDLKPLYDEDNREYWQDWNFKDKLIFAHIKEVDVANNDVVVNISPPRYQNFSDRGWRVHVKCSKPNSVALSENNTLNSVIDHNFNLLDRAKAGDTLISYCLEESCINLGNKCYLVVR